MATLITGHPPEAFGLQWTTRRLLQDGRTLFVASDDTPEFTEAYALARRELRLLGYSMLEARAGDPWSGYRPAFWLAREGWSEGALRYYRDDLVPALKAKKAEEERRRERDRRWAEEERASAAAAVSGARAAAEDSLAHRWWAWSKTEQIEEARALLARPELTASEAARLAKLAANADANVARANEASAALDAREASLAADPAVRQAAREGLSLLTARDVDRAQEVNGEGWGRSTTVMGHVLAGVGELSEAQASHALRILRTHRRQLPRDLAARLFDVALAQPSLGL